MSIGLPSDLDQFVQREVASGRFASAEEVISEGLRGMRDADEEYQEWRAEIARRIASLERGEGIELDYSSLGTFFDEIQAEVREELAAEKREATTDN